MSYFGFYAYDGVEITNTARTESYVDQLGISFWTCPDLCDDLVPALESRGWKEPSQEYASPAETAPWYDPAYPYSAEFAGMVLLDATMQHSSTHVGTVQERSVDGGVLLPRRRQSREMLFRALLIGKNELAAHYGLTWITSILTGGDVCRGKSKYQNTYSDVYLNLDFYKRASEVDPLPDNVYQLPLVYDFEHSYRGFRAALSNLVPVEQVETFPDLRTGPGRRLDYLPVCPDLEREKNAWRHMVDVGCTIGPAVISEHSVGDSDCGAGHWIEIEFAMSAGSPGIWHDSLGLDELLTDFAYSDFPVEWLRYKDADTTVDDDVFNGPPFTSRTRTYSGLQATIYDRKITPLPNPAEQAGVSSIVEIIDPLCPPVPQFPPTPQDDLLCAPLVADGDRRVYVLDNVNVPKYLPLAVQMQMTAFEEMRNIRVSLVPRTGSFEGDGTSLEFWVTYLPPLSTIIIDSKARRTTAIPFTTSIADLTLVPAGHLVVLDESGTQFDYPELVCPDELSLVVSVPQGSDIRALATNVRLVARDM